MHASARSGAFDSLAFCMSISASAAASRAPLPADPIRPSKGCGTWRQPGAKRGARASGPGTSRQQVVVGCVAGDEVACDLVGPLVRQRWLEASVVQGAQG